MRKRNSSATSATRGLREYQRKRDFKLTSEPEGSTPALAPDPGRLRYVIQKHQASHLHYDFRLEWGGVLVSWAIPKGPSLDPAVKRLATPVEDHPLEYGGFEGVIPEGQYGAGTVLLWDRGTWTPDDPDVTKSLREGELKFSLSGEKLKGSWVLVRTKLGYPRGSTKPQWLLMKHRDRFVSSRDILLDEPRSVATNRLLAEIAQDDGGDVAKAAKGDPAAAGSKPVRGRSR